MKIRKRDGRIVEFDSSRIKNAIEACFIDLGKNPELPYEYLTWEITNVIKYKYKTPTVEQIQDTVENVLLIHGEFEAAKHYILYREEHNKIRVPEDVKLAIESSSKYFPTPIQEFQFFDKYSRFNYNLNRRETWIETVDRTVDFLFELAGTRLESHVYDEIRKAILDMKVMPSLRLLAMAGEAARRDNTCVYNCSYLPVNSIESFKEALLISMAGCGVGFSVEEDYVENFPRIVRQKNKISNFTIEDTSKGWGQAVEYGINSWFNGEDVKFDFSQLRPAGTPLRTKGGRSSGPDPLKEMLRFTRERILNRQGSFLRPLDAHDIMCSIGNAAISGGMRRTAMISLFDSEDVRHCKDGYFDVNNNQRWNANNSRVWNEKPSQLEFTEYFLDMVKGERGEPGIFNRPDNEVRYGTNPCGEIILKPFQFCNLSAAVARPDDTRDTLKEKIKIATIIGTIQSLATYFPDLRNMWAKNCEEERLLGVDITGQMDCPILSDSLFSEMRDLVWNQNKKTSQVLNINPSRSVTCVKPSGNSSQLLNCSSGLHARWAPYYIRNIRVSAHSPIYKVLRDAKVPMHPENGQGTDAITYVIHFPVKSPDNTVTRHDRSAIEQCEWWLINKVNWTTHNPSCTITYKPDEIIDLMKWVWDHWDLIGGLSFLPASEANYSQAPYEEITKEEYDKLEFPKIDYSKLYLYEKDDMTTAAQELACSSGLCSV